MITLAVDELYLNKLWRLSRKAGFRLIIRRQDPVATDESVFILELLAEDGSMIAEVTTKNLESAAKWILDQRRRHRA